MASACSSNISVPKSTGANSSSSSNRRKSCDTTCSTNSSCFLQKKKPINPLAVSVRSFSQPRSDVRQRVLSAKLIKLRNLQNQLNDANFHLMELAKENRALKTLQKRQDKALNNYEGINADLPRLIKSHEEENRVLVEKNRSLKKKVRELAEQFKLKDEELLSVKDNLKHITYLSKDKHLGEREKLKSDLEEAKMQIRKYEEELNILNRKMILEAKNAKHKLNSEVIKHKRCQRELAGALIEIEKLSENKDRPVRRFENSSKHDGLALLNTDLQAAESVDGSLKEDNLSDGSSEIKLEPISTRSDLSDSSNKVRNTMESPVEKIKARLSGNQNKSININEITHLMEKLNAEEENLKKPCPMVKTKNKKLETIIKPIIKNKTEINIKVVNSSDNSDEENEKQKIKDAIEIKKDDEEEIEEFEKMLKLEIKSSVENDEDSRPDILLKDEDFDLVNQIWDEEYQFRAANLKEDDASKNEPKVALEHKKKLLAALRDIDNGKSIDDNDDATNNQNVEIKKHKLMRELFG